MNLHVIYYKKRKYEKLFVLSELDFLEMFTGERKQKKEKETQKEQEPYYGS